MNRKKQQITCPLECILSKEDLNHCIEFSKKSAPTQQDIEFGQHDVRARDVKEIARDNLIGKIAEAAFKKIIEENFPDVGEIPLDFSIYERGVYDNLDSDINGSFIDIKATREGGEWFLIEWNKLIFRAKEKQLPHYFVFFTVGWDRNMDQPTGRAVLEGIIPIEWLSKEHVDKEDRIFVLKKGERIPGKNVRLQADNYGINKKYIGRSLGCYMRRMIDGNEKYNRDDFKLP